MKSFREYYKLSLDYLFGNSTSKYPNFIKANGVFINLDKVYYIRPLNNGRYRMYFNDSCPNDINANFNKLLN